MSIEQTPHHRPHFLGSLALRLAITRGWAACTRGKRRANRSDILRLLLRLRKQHGDLLCFRTLRGRKYILSDPDLVYAALHAADGTYVKGRQAGNLRPFFGNGLLVSDDEHSKRRHSLIQQSLIKSKINAFMPLMLEETDAMLARWSRGPEAAALNVSAEMTRLSTYIILRAVFGSTFTERLPEIAKELTERCGLSDARVRLTLTAGPEDGQPVLLLQAWPATDYPPEMYTHGVTAMIASVRRNETSPLTRIKSLSNLDNLLAKREALQAGADEALLLNTQGSLAEASIANLFIVLDGHIRTPPIADGVLPGVTRNAVLELAEAAEIAAREATLTVDDLRRADEAFLTNAIAGVLPLVAVDGRNVGSGEPGELTGRLRALYEAAAAAA
ncbi:MAG: cytochrome P450 [Chloroflexi bacterium]|nr:cytochrome P450 [Chloroflexota bacterium]